MDEFSENSEAVEVVYLDSEDEFYSEEMEQTAEHLDMSNDLGRPQIHSSKLTFMKHCKSVFCGDISKNDELAATGGEDDTAYIWAVKDGDLKFECTGHKDSITCVCFNHDDQLLATGDMAGMIQVWEIKENKLIWCHEGDEMEWLMWHPVTNVLISGTQSGCIFVWQIPQGNFKLLPSSGFSCTCGKLMPDGKQLIAGYEDGQIKFWDIKTVNAKWSMLVSQKKSVTSIAVNADGSLCSVAPSSSLLKTTDGKLLGTLLRDGESEIEAHIFCSSMNLLITGSLSGNICVWDLHKCAIRHQATLDCGITTLSLDMSNRLFIGCIGGLIYVCDVKTGALVEILTGHKGDILSLCASHDFSFVLTTSDDNTAKIFIVTSP